MPDERGEPLAGDGEDGRGARGWRQDPIFPGGMDGGAERGSPRVWEGVGGGGAGGVARGGICAGTLPHPKTHASDPHAETAALDLATTAAVGQ